MLAIIYVALAVWLGDVICRRFYRFISIPHRFAGAFLIGLLASSWVSYLAARVFAATSRPLMWGNLVFFGLAILLFALTRRKETKEPIDESHQSDSPLAARIDDSATEENEFAEVSSEIPTPVEPTDNAEDQPATPATSPLDWALIVVYFVLAVWLMFATLSSSGNQLQIGNNQFSDFGPNTAIMQSFAVGHNFPTEYPHFAGQRIRYHFMFYFAAGNLEFLGLDPAWSLNVLSILSLVGMLVLVMGLGEALFNSRAVGRLGSALFFFFGSLSYIPYLRKQGSLSAALHAMRSERAFLTSGFPYRGEEWGVWSLVVFLNQRHLAFAIGVVLLVLIFLVLRYRDLGSEMPASASDSLREQILTSSASVANQYGAAAAAPATADAAPGSQPFVSFISGSRAFIFCGVVLGLLPMWNSAVFAAAAVVLAALFILFPLRKQMLALAIATGVVALPQVIYLSTGSGRAPSPGLLHWGYTLDRPTIWNVVKYLGFTFGFKWVLIAIALGLASSLQRRFFIAISTLIGVAFLLQLSAEVLANHKFLHIWLIIANLFVAYGIWCLWHLRIRGSTLPSRALAIILLLLIIPGGLIDLFPIHNGYWTEVTYKNSRLIEWLTKETDPRAIFLTDRFVNHPILMAGRRVFYGWPYYAWSAGYRTAERDLLYRQMWEERNPQALLKLLHDNNVAYVALDEGVRQGEFGRNLNEPVYRKYLPAVFQEGGLTIFKVPATINAPATVGLPKEDLTPAVNMFTGGKGTGKGQFNWPRGVAIDDRGNVLVADTNNGRIERFSADGSFIGSFGNIGEGDGEFKEPVAVVVDRRGNIYIADFINRRLQKLKSDGTFIAQWRGPDQNFAPRDLAIGDDGFVYVADEGGARIVKFDSNGKVAGVFGAKGTSDGQFDQLTSVAVDNKNHRLLVADPRNRRIVVFDTDGKFIANWFVDEWRVIENAWYLHDLIVDAKADRIYATSTQTDEVVVLDLAGNKIGSLKPAPPDKLEGASSLALSKGKLYVVDTFAAHLSRIDISAASPSPTASPGK
jgi:DNA-binding beta-propeller fold protein YncE